MFNYWYWEDVVKEEVKVNISVINIEIGYYVCVVINVFLILSGYVIL